MQQVADVFHGVVPSSSISPSQRPLQAAGRPWVLAVDLDGTFLGGGPEGRHALYSALSCAPDVILVFCTGRSLESVMPILHDPAIPRPHFIIADVGGTVVDGQTLAPIEPLQSEISSRWPGRARVLAAFKPFRELIPQTVPQENRCSFIAPGADHAIHAAAHALGCEVLFSGGRYLDILPAGVSKGSTLSRLMALHQWHVDDVVVAGDSLNDLSLYQLGSPGVLLANAEIGLRAAILKTPRVQVARSEGAAGLLEGLQSLALLPKEPPQIAPEPGRASLVIVYHRAPVEVDTRGEPRAQPHTNGILPTLAGLARRGWDAAWVCATPASRAQPQQFGAMRLSGVPLTAEENAAFYHTFCKDALWPVLMSTPDQMRFDAAGFRLYESINGRFADRAAAEAAPGATIWIHDYNLWLVPSLLKRMRPDVRVGFFHHTPFPPTEIFRALPVASQVLGSLLHCDFVGFHVPRYAVNFADAACSTGSVTVVKQQECSPRLLTCGASLGVPQMPSLLEADGRLIKLGAHPVGIDVRYVESLREAPLKPEWQVPAGVQRVLSLERLDYTKAPVERLEAFELFLAQSERPGQVEHVFAYIPPADAVRAYDKVWQAVCETTDRINQRFGSASFQPVRLLKGPFPFKDIVALYLTASVLWITAKRDGLNLVAKEFVVAQSAAGGEGTLVLSSFAGVAQQLRAAVLTNPYDIQEMASTLDRALLMPAGERRRRLRAMAEAAAETDVERWAENMLTAIRTPDAKASGRNTVTLPMERFSPSRG